jgi:uncharacterized membrane protein YtjA (UPF0391 family)
VLDVEQVSKRTPHTASPEEIVMLYWAVLFFVLAIVAAVFGFGGIAASATMIGKVLFIGFLVLAIASLALGRKPATGL